MQNRSTVVIPLSTWLMPPQALVKEIIKKLPQDGLCTKMLRFRLVELAEHLEKKHVARELNRRSARQHEAEISRRYTAWALASLVLDGAQQSWSKDPNYYHALLVRLHEISR